MAEIPDAGKHCAVRLCNKRDFAPFTCRICKKFYCGLHRFEHGCANPNAEYSAACSDGAVKRNFLCSLSGCTAREFVRIECSHCGSNFCLSHRQCEDHNCTSISRPNLVRKTPQPAPSQQAVQSTATAKTIKSFTPEQRAKLERVAVMQLKLKNLLRISGEEQLFLFAVIANDGEESAENDEHSPQPRAAVIVSKFWTVGKAVDSIVRQLSLDCTKRWIAVKRSDDGTHTAPFPSDDLIKHFGDREEIRLKATTS